jgi:hypothetical protein
MLPKDTENDSNFQKYLTINTLTSSLCELNIFSLKRLEVSKTVVPSHYRQGAQHPINFLKSVGSVSNSICSMPKHPLSDETPAMV